MGNTINDFTASTTTFNEIVGTSSSYLDRTLDLSSFVGQSIYFAARHHNCTDWFRINMDDFVIADSSSGSVGVLTNSITNQVNFVNTANNTVQVVINGDLNNGNITLTSISGKNISVMAVNSKTETVNLNGLASGLYMLNVKFNEGSITKKIFVK